MKAIVHDKVLKVDITIKTWKKGFFFFFRWKKGKRKILIFLCNFFFFYQNLLIFSDFQSQSNFSFNCLLEFASYLLIYLFISFIFVEFFLLNESFEEKSKCNILVWNGCQFTDLPDRCRRRSNKRSSVGIFVIF